MVGDTKVGEEEADAAGCEGCPGAGVSLDEGETGADGLATGGGAGAGEEEAAVCVGVCVVAFLVVVFRGVPCVDVLDGGAKVGVVEGVDELGGGGGGLVPDDGDAAYGGDFDVWMCVCVFMHMCVNYYY